MIVWNDIKNPQHDLNPNKLPQKNAMAKIFEFLKTNLWISKEICNLCYIYMYVCACKFKNKIK